MTLVVTHAFVSPVTDAGNPNEVGPNEWNANHTVTGEVVVQVVNFQTGAVATGTPIIPMDDTIPQITEGTEFMTLAITPKSATNKLLIDVRICGCSTVVTSLVAALFQDSTANALAAVELQKDDGNKMSCFSLTHCMTAGTTSSTTFRVRAGGGAAGTFTFNGATNGTRRFGGVCASSITITEYAP
jgi:Pgp3 C-terminal domain